MGFQTIFQFLQAPFGEPEIKSNEFEQKYNALKTAKRIYVEGYTIIEDNHLMHLKVGSDSNREQFYDVVIMFFTDNEKVKREMSLKNYYVKFFSNSPSFIYQYAVLYKKHGFLIDMLYDKLDPEYKDKLPEKTNTLHKMSYDKSIYGACRFLQDHSFTGLNKMGELFRKRKNPDKFFQDIKDFMDVKLTQEIRALDKKIDKELDIAKKKKKDAKKERRKNTKKSPIVARTSTLSTGVSPTRKIAGNANRVVKKAKKAARKSTIRK